jgi:hypothetical protein
VWASNERHGQRVTFKAHYQQHVLGELTVPRALAPTVVTGDPVCLEVATAEPPFTVTAVHGTGFIDRNAPSDQAGAVARGLFFPGFVPAYLSGHD